MVPQKYKVRYQPLGYEYFLPNILQIADLSTSFDAPNLAVQNVTRHDQADLINSSFADFKPFPERLLESSSNTAFFVEIDGQAAGWGYLNHSNSHAAYVAGMFTSPNFRHQGAASAILKEMHNSAHNMGFKKIILSPSFMAWNFYTKRGYQTFAHYSTFLPSAKKETANS